MEIKGKYWKIRVNQAKKSMEYLGVPKEYISVLTKENSSFNKETGKFRLIIFFFFKNNFYSFTSISKGWGWDTNENKYLYNFAYQGELNLRKEKLNKLFK